MMLAGPLASAVGELGSDRWFHATAGKLGPIRSVTPDIWPQDLFAQFENIAVGIARTRAEYADLPEIREIEALYLDMIAAATRFIYIENQYFTSAKIAAAIAKRMQENDPPAIVMVMPRSADGWLEQIAMDAARVRLAREIGKREDRNRFRIYVPITQKGGTTYADQKSAVQGKSVSDR